LVCVGQHAISAVAVSNTANPVPSNLISNLQQTGIYRSLRSLQEPLLRGIMGWARRARGGLCTTSRQRDASGEQQSQSHG